MIINIFSSKSEKINRDLRTPLLLKLSGEDSFQIVRAKLHFVFL